MMDDNSVSYLAQLILSRSSKNCVNNTHKRDYYRGTFTSDKLMKNKRLKFNISSRGSRHNFLFCFVVNTLTHEGVYNGQVGHWLAISIRYDNCRNYLTVHFFDSFAKNYSNYNHVKGYVDWVKSACALNNVKFIYDSLNFPIQDTFSKLCGVYVCRAVARVWESKHGVAGGSTLDHMFSTYGRDRRDNDLKMIRYLYKEWTTAHCHNTPFPWKIIPIKNLLMTSAPPAFCPKKTLGLSKCSMTKCKCQ